MTTWLLDRAHQADGRSFDVPPGLDLDEDDTVYVYDPGALAVVGEFELPEKPVSLLSQLDGGQTILHPGSDKLVRITDPKIVEELKKHEDSEIPSSYEGYLEKAHEKPGEGVKHVSPDSFFGGDEGTSEDTAETSKADEPTSGPTLQEVFNRGRGVEGEDFSGDEVPGDIVLADTSLRGSVLADTRLCGVTFENVNLRDVDFRGAELEEATFTGTETRLGGADFTNANLESTTFEVDVSNCEFAGAQLIEADLNEAALESADFTDARLKRAEMKRSEPDRATFDGAIMDGVKTTGTNFKKASFVGADLSNTTFSGVTFEDVDFQRADLEDVVFDDCNLDDIRFDEADMEGVEMENHETENLNFERADLGEADLSDTVFDSARFDGARLSMADLGGCDLTGVSLSDVGANRASFDDANLEYATLADADLTDASFDGTKLYECNLLSARVGTETDFEEIYRYDERRVVSDSASDEGPNSGSGRSSSLETDNTPAARKSASIHQTLEAVYRDNSMTEESLEYLRRRKRAAIRAELAAGNWTGTLPDRFLGKTTRHGTSLRSVFRWSGIAIFLTSLAHLLLGTLRHETLGRLAPINGSTSAGAALMETFYYGLLTFTGLGYDQVVPVGWAGVMLATLQNALGVVFFGLLIFVFSTRAAR